jgi:collagenase-like PrtC family protease
MPVPTRIICKGDGTVVVGIVINESVLRIETIIARVGAPIAPGREMPCRPGMHGATCAARSKVCSLRRSAHAAENGRCNCCRDDYSLHAGATHYHSPKMDHGPGLSPKPGRDGKSQRQDWLNNGGRLSLMVSADPSCLEMPCQIDSPTPSSTAYWTISDTCSQPLPLKPATTLMRTICTRLSRSFMVSTVWLRI